MSHTPEVLRSDDSHVISECRLIFMTTLLEVTLLTHVFVVGDARLATMTEPIITLAMSFFSLRAASYLRRVIESCINEIFLQLECL